MLQSRLTTRYLELVHSIYTEPVEEKLMGELVFNFVMTLPPLMSVPPATSKKKHKRKKKTTFDPASSGSRDIREMFLGGKKSKKTQPENCVIIDC